MKHIDDISNMIIEFILKILGAFGACWGTFSAIDVTYKHIFNVQFGQELMNNFSYFKLSLGFSIMASILSFFVLLRKHKL